MLTTNLNIIIIIIIFHLYIYIVILFTNLILFIQIYESKVNTHHILQNLYYPVTKEHELYQGLLTTSSVQSCFGLGKSWFNFFLQHSMWPEVSIWKIVCTDDSVMHHWLISIWVNILSRTSSSKVLTTFQFSNWWGSSYTSPSKLKIKNLNYQGQRTKHKWENKRIFSTPLASLYNYNRASRGSSGFSI